MGNWSELDTKVNVSLDTSELDELIEFLSGDPIFAPAIEIAQRYKKGIEEAITEAISYDKKILVEKAVENFNKLNEYITCSEGPDILFFYPLLPLFHKYKKINTFAGIVHRTKVNDFFISLVNDIKKDKNFDKFIFLCGLVTHYVGDTTCHPFVNYKAKVLEQKLKKKKEYHFMIEAYIDNYIVNLKGEYYKKFRGYKLLKTTKNEKIKEMLNRCFYKVYNKKDMGNNYYKSLWNMKFLFYLIRYDPYKIKRIGYSFLYFLLPFLKQDIRYFSYNFNLTEKENEIYLNLNHDEWFNINKKDVKYNKSFLDLYKEVVDKSTYMIQVLYDYIYNDKEIDLDTFFGNLSYANGLKIDSNKNKTAS